MSLTSILADGDTVVAVAHEHPCSEASEWLDFGWRLGVGWSADARIYVGTSADDLALTGPGDHPFAGPLRYDCDPASSSFVAKIRTPSVGGDMLAGVITLYEIFEQPNADELDPDTGGQRRWTQLVDDTWEVTTVTGVPVQYGGGGSPEYLQDVFHVDGDLVILETGGSGSALRLPRLVVESDGTAPALVNASRGVWAKDFDAAAWGVDE